MSKNRMLIVLLAALGLLTAACGTDSADESATDSSSAAATSSTAGQDEPASEEGASDQPATEDAVAEDATTGDAATSGGDYPVTIESSGGTWTIESAPQKIVSLSPAATEILFAVGAGEQVVAVDSFSYYPEAAPVTDLSGWDPNVEAVVAFEPDLVIISNDANELVSSLTALDIPVLVSAAPADIEGGYAAMAEIGLATGHVDETASAVATMRSEIEAALAAAPDAPIRIYHELDETFFSASSFGFIGAVYAEMGATNIADNADSEGYGFPQLTEEYIVEADPELIVITDQVAYSAADVMARPGWDGISAVTNGNVVVVNADVASRWGPRLPQFIEAVAEALTSATVPAS